MQIVRQGTLAIEDYALIGDTRTAALVSKTGSIDWLCVPRFDSGACLASLLGEPRHGHWALHPVDGSTRQTRRRYPVGTRDGLPPGEGVFLLCSFWLADNYALLGRDAEARALFERLLAIRNDVGLLSEEYDPAARHLLGNFPQALSHVGLVNTALNLTRRARAPAAERPST